jgi:hypothetical protein
MARVVFTQNIQRHVTCPPAEVSGGWHTLTGRKGVGALLTLHAFPSVQGVPPGRDAE